MAKRKLLRKIKIRIKKFLARKVYKKQTLEQALYRTFLLLCALITLCSLGITLYFDISRERKNTDKIISGTASYIASMPEVIQMLENGYPDANVKLDLDSLSSNIPDINVVVIYDTNGLRFYHTDRLKTGETFVDGDETDILSGSAPYITTGYGTFGTQRRAFHAVRNESNEIIGFVMVSIFNSAITARHKYIFLLHAFIFLIMMMVSISLTHTFIAYLRRSLLGFNPEELAALYTRQAEVMNSLSEGLVATDRNGQILFANRTAKQFLSTENHSISGCTLSDVYPQTQLLRILASGESSPPRTVEINGRTLLISEVPIHGQSGHSIRGIIVILADRTEMLQLSDELSGAHNMLDTLRAFNHEFLNKLHIILGYLHTGEIQKAIDFITNSSLVTSQSVREAANCIRVSRLCALVIGKMMHAAELGIQMTVAPDSSCFERDLLLPVDTYITIIGNLVENAIEELAECQKDTKEIRLSLYCRPDVNIIICEDTGRGIRPELLEHIFEKGVSSKGKNRGTGLFLLQRIAGDYHGDITIDTEPDEGSCFTLTFTRKEIS